MSTFNLFIYFSWVIVSSRTSTKPTESIREVKISRFEQTGTGSVILFMNFASISLYCNEIIMDFYYYRPVTSIRMKGLGMKPK